MRWLPVSLLRTALLILGVASALAAPLSAQAATTVSKQTLDLTLPCHGDLVHLTGTLLGTDTATTTPSGGEVTAYHLTAQGVTATDLVTGTVFRAPGVERDLIVNSPPGGSTETFVQQIRFVSNLGVFTITDLVHVTVTPDGTVRVSFDNFSATCF